MFTTMERLSMETNPTYGAVIKYSDRVFATDDYCDDNWLECFQLLLLYYQDAV